MFHIHLSDIGQALRQATTWSPILVQVDKIQGRGIADDVFVTNCGLVLEQAAEYLKVRK